MKRSKLAILVFAIVVASLSLPGSASVWYGSSNDLWNNSANWDTLPTASSNVYIDGSRANIPVRVVSGDNALASHIMMGQLSNTGTAELKVEGGSLGLTYDMWLGYNYGGQGVLTVTGGTVGGTSNDYVRSMIVGYKNQTDTSFDLVEGIVDVSGTGLVHAWNTYLPYNANGKGTIDIYDNGYYKTRNMYLSWGSYTGDGSINLYGGTFEIYAWMGIDSSRGHIEIYDGELKFTYGGDLTTQVQDWVDAGYITGYGSKDNVRINVADGVTTVTAVPEPVSVLLLGLGGLFIKRKRR